MDDELTIGVATNANEDIEAEYAEEMKRAPEVLVMDSGIAALGQINANKAHFFTMNAFRTDDPERPDFIGLVQGRQGGETLYTPLSLERAEQVAEGLLKAIARMRGGDTVN